MKHLHDDNPALTRMVLNATISPELGWSRLHVAANMGAEYAIQVLIGQGLDPNHRDHEGRTPLLFAAWNGHVGAMKLLLSNGADPSIRDGIGFLLTEIRWIQKSRKVMNLLVRAIANEEAKRLSERARSKAPKHGTPPPSDTRMHHAL